MLKILIIALLFIPNFSQAVSRTEFYLNPTLNNFLTEVGLEKNDYRKAGFIVSAFTKHPNLVYESAKNLSNFNKELKSKIIEGIANLNDKEINQKLPADYLSIINSTKPTVTIEIIDSIKFNTAPQTLEELKTNINNIELLWGALFATGESKYLEKILESIRVAPKNVKLLALELIHHESHFHLKEKALCHHYTPEYDQVLKYISTITKLNKFQIMNYYLILDSLQQEIYNHANLRSKLNQLISSNQKYNYYKDLNLI